MNLKRNHKNHPHLDLPLLPLALMPQSKQKQCSYCYCEMILIIYWQLQTHVREFPVQIWSPG